MMMEKMCCSKCVVKCNMRGQAQATNEWRQVTSNRTESSACLSVCLCVCVSVWNECMCVYRVQTNGQRLHTQTNTRKLNTLNRHSFTSTRFFLSLEMNEWMDEQMNEWKSDSRLIPFFLSLHAVLPSLLYSACDLVEFHLMARLEMGSRSTARNENLLFFSHNCYCVDWICIVICMRIDFDSEIRFIYMFSVRAVNLIDCNFSALHMVHPSILLNLCRVDRWMDFSHTSIGSSSISVLLIHFLGTCTMYQREVVTFRFSADRPRHRAITCPVAMHAMRFEWPHFIQLQIYNNNLHKSHLKRCTSCENAFICWHSYFVSTHTHKHTYSQTIHIISANDNVIDFWRICVYAHLFTLPWTTWMRRTRASRVPILTCATF